MGVGRCWPSRLRAGAVRRTDPSPGSSRLRNREPGRGGAGSEGNGERRDERRGGGAMRSAEGRGRTLDEAVDAALIELGESRRNVDVRVISEGPDETVVEVVAIDQATAPAVAASPANGKAEAARALVEGLLKHMGVRAQVTVRTGTDPITLDISGRDLGGLIGWRGETLRALQSVTNVMFGKNLAEGEREIALRAARQVKMTGDAITLDAMQAFERRAIHLALQDDPDVGSSSIGEEPDRRVVVGPRKPASN